MAEARGVSLHATEDKLRRVTRKLVKGASQLFEQIRDRERQGGDAAEIHMENQTDLFQIQKVEE